MQKYYVKNIFKNNNMIHIIEDVLNLLEHKIIIITNSALIKKYCSRTKKKCKLYITRQQKLWINF